jgi:tRNA dimethylallyltransferase
MKPRIVVILGPTAVGKSDLALELARRIDGEIVNADSQQVYRFMDIGTAKPSLADRERVRHYLIDVVNPDEEFNVAKFRRLATAAIRQVHERNHRALVCGGTGLYLKALTRGLFEGAAQDPDIRRKLHREVDEKGLGYLYKRLLRIDSSVASTIHPNDRQRTVRALEVFQVTGKPLSQWQRDHAFREAPFEVLKIGLNRERPELYDLINRRCERMIRDGLMEEVQRLTDKGYGLYLKPLRSVGYLQIGRALRGLQKLPEALEEMKQQTRRLAKRQLTWFRADPEIAWFHPNERLDIVNAVKRFLFEQDRN